MLSCYDVYEDHFYFFEIISYEDHLLLFSPGVQALCEELTRKAADLQWENENLKQVGNSTPKLSIIFL